MNKFLFCGEKIENVKRALVVAILFQIYSFLPYESQSEFQPKQTRREQFKKRQKSAQKERRKEHNRTLNSTKKVNKDKKQCLQYVHQGIFNYNEIDKQCIKNSITSLFVDIEHKMRETFADPELVASVSTKLASVISAIHLLKGEKKPSKIIATLTLAITSIAPELSQRSIRGTLIFQAIRLHILMSALVLIHLFGSLNLMMERQKYSGCLNFLNI